MKGFDVPEFYVKAIKSYTRTTAAQDVELFKRHKQGDRQATDKLVRNCLGLVVKWVNKYSNMADTDELMGVGHHAIMVALTKYNPKKKVKFATYAEHWIKAYMIREAKSADTVVSMGADTFAGKNLSLNENVSTDHGGVDENIEFIDLLRSKELPQDEVAIKIDMAKAVNDTLQRLNDDHRNVLKLRFMSNEDITLEMVGHKQMLGRRVNRERVRQIQIDAIKTFKLIHMHHHADYAETT